MTTGTLKQRIFAPIARLLAEGLTPEKMSQALAVGFVLGMTPMIGISSIIAVMLAAVFRLNQVAIQVANYAAYPVQLLMFIPYIRAGEWLLGLEGAAVNPTEIASMFSDDFQASLKHYGRSLMAGLLAWLLTAVPVTLALMYPLKLSLRRVMMKRHTAMGSTEVDE